ncbi:TetR/AcrR family transcriptional regulator [Aureimonas sp. AU40]|uniref:TetR/AcrR family transcriptional regulator n=1 Tax=Aureimonas sp. AU40 TaxID=1637747 RepID=UPI000783BABE|nr:TetR/AcrR family transcriptional regulator [Aureimonas sp. AU40]
MPRVVAERADSLAPLAEVFRRYGYEGASLALIGKATGLGKGSLYHFFPGGKDEMLSAVLAEIEVWFERHIFAPLESEAAAGQASEAMFDAVSDYFRSGRRVCLMGTLALGEGRDRFALAIARYFARWIEALANALRREGSGEEEALLLAEETVAGIQGAIVLARALDQPAVFERALAQWRERLRRPDPV